MNALQAKALLRSILVIASLTLAMVGALWLAGVLFYGLHRSLPHDVTPLTWMVYAKSYWSDQDERKLLSISLFISGAVAVLPLGFLFQWLGGKDPELHGSARFASLGEIHKAGLMGSSGIIVGRYQNRFLQFPGQQFCLLAAPTRSGKGVSFVIPNLLNWPDSCVVLDIKLENYRLTSGYRARHGQTVFLFNPFAEDGQTHRWNPLDGISRNPNLRVGDLLALGSSLYPAGPGDKDAFWSDSAKNLFLGLALMVMETEELPATFGEILRQSSGKGLGLKDYLTDRLNARQAENTPYSPECIEALHRFLSASENTLANIISAFTAPLVLFANPVVDAATSASDFDLGQLRDERMSVYIGIQPNRLADAALLLNVLFSQLINLNTKALPSKDKHAIPCLLILDEFPALGRINVLARANAFIAGYGLRLLTIIQSLSQLEGVYGQHDARTLITNHAMQVLFTPREQKDANAYSEMLGVYTVKTTSKGRSTNQGFSAGGSTSENVSDQKRALLLPQELKEMSDDDQIIILENTKPIKAKKARFFKEPAFIDRLKETSPALKAQKGIPAKAEVDDIVFRLRELEAPVPVLDIDQHVARTQYRVRPLRAFEVVDLSQLDLKLETLPGFSDPDDPTDEEAQAVVDTFFRLGKVTPQMIEFACEDDEDLTANMMMEA